MKKHIFLLIILTLALYASEDKSLWDKTTSELNFLWESTKDISSEALEKAKDVSSEALEKAKDVSDEALEKAKDVSDEAWEKTKEYADKTKNFTLEQALINSTNLSLDTNYIKIEELTINDKKININIMLKGEDKNLNILLNNFDWSISKDKENIVLKNLDINLDIPWLAYLFKQHISMNNNFLILPYSPATEALLMAIKSSVECKKENVKELPQKWKQLKKSMFFVWKNRDKNTPFTTMLKKLFVMMYDKQYIKLNSLDINDEKVHMIYKLNGSKNMLDIRIDDFGWATANKKSLLAIKDLKLYAANRPWINSLIQKQNSELIFNYDPLLEVILYSIKSPFNSK